LIVLRLDSALHLSTEITGKTGMIVIETSGDPFLIKMDTHGNDKPVTNIKDFFVSGDNPKSEIKDFFKVIKSYENDILWERK